MDDKTPQLFCFMFTALHFSNQASQHKPLSVKQYKVKKKLKKTNTGAASKQKKLWTKNSNYIQVKIHNLPKKKRTYCILLISHPYQLGLLLDNMPPNSVSKLMVKRSSHCHSFFFSFLFLFFFFLITNLAGRRACKFPDFFFFLFFSFLSFLFIYLFLCNSQCISRCTNSGETK